MKAERSRVPDAEMDKVLRKMLATPPQPHDKKKISGKQRQKNKPAK
jgi:hypothetical protein